MYSASFQTLSAVSLPFPRWVAPRSSCLHSFLRSFDVIHILIYQFLPPLRYLPTTRRVSFARFSFPSFFLFFPLSFPFYERNIPYPARSLPLCVRPLPASHSAFTCSPLPRIMATTLPYGIGGNGIAALGFRWMWYFWFAADSFAMSFLSFVFSSSLFFFGDFIYLWSSFWFLWFFVWEEFVDEFDWEWNE